MNDVYMNTKLTREELESAGVLVVGYQPTELIHVNDLKEADRNRAIIYIEAELKFQREAREEQ